MANPPDLPAELQRALCDVNRNVFRLDDQGAWLADDALGPVIVLQTGEVAELLRRDLAEVTSNAVLIPTEMGRTHYLDCAAAGHARHS
jgi:hypothetical protein